ncbi:MerR family transcriptional regulator [Labedella populi]|uniref:MerR family transcriptional regulator n=1 Tax=Labedella populi TaxID=2498850 RepID=UPI001409C1AC|nr:MerR family transcriptional regulator [Labedella populi]
MRISDLSRSTGVSIPSIKYYIREGVLAPGDADGPNRSSYGEAHVARLRLIRGLIEGAGVTIAGVKQIVAALDGSMPLNDSFGVAQAAVPLAGRDAPVDPSSDAVERVLAVTEGIGRHHPAVPIAARALDTFAVVGEPLSEAWLARYAEAAAIVARADFDELEQRSDPVDQARIAAVGTALGDIVFQSLRRIAQATEGERRFPSPPASSSSPADTETAS